MVIFHSAGTVYHVDFNGSFYPLVNVYIAMERSTMLSMGKSTISMAIFNSFLYVHQRVSMG